MRLMLTFRPQEEFPKSEINRHMVRAMIYSLLIGTPYEEVHDRRTFKFFCFSDIFPVGDFSPEEEKHLIISSPDEAFIETLHDRILNVNGLHLRTHMLDVVSVKVFRLRPGKTFITGSPVVVRTLEGGYFTFLHRGDFEYFLRRLTLNAVHKYEAFTGERFELDGPLFTRMVPRVRKNGFVDIFERVRIKDRTFTIAGSAWKLLEVPLNESNREFYSFIMEAGIGELNSMGYGFLNPLKRQKNRRKWGRKNGPNPSQAS